MASKSRDRARKSSVSGPALIPAGELSGKPAIPLSRPIIVMGSRETSRIHLISRTVSKSHALLVVTRHTVFVRDLTSREGTFINGERVVERDLTDGDILKVGRFEFIFTAGGANLRPHREKPPVPGVLAPVVGDAPPVPLETRVTLIGRKQNADIPFLESGVSAAHAVIVAWEGKRYIRDLGSRTGTFVNGSKVHQQELRPLDQIRIGDTDLAYEISTEGAGVDVVASPTESAVVRAVAAEELPLVEPAGDTVTMNAPEVDAPDVRSPAGAFAAAEPPAPPRPMTPFDTLPLELEAPEADAAEQPFDDAHASAPGIQALPRRGWHRPGGGAEAGETLEEPPIPLDATPGEHPVEDAEDLIPPTPQPHAAEPLAAESAGEPAESEIDLSGSATIGDEGSDAFDALDEIVAAAEAQADAPIVEPAAVAPSMGEAGEEPPIPLAMEAGPEPATPPPPPPPEPVAAAPRFDAAVPASDPLPDPMVEEAAAEAEAAMTTAETTVSAEASVDDLSHAESLPPAASPIDLTPAAAASPSPADSVEASPAPEIPLAAVEPEPEHELEPASADLPPTPVLEVVEATEPTPDSAQPLADIEVTEPPPEPEAAATGDVVVHGTIHLDAAGPVADAASDPLSDTAFSREVAALSESRIGEPIVLEAPRPPEPADEPPAVEAQVQLPPEVTEEVAAPAEPPAAPPPPPEPMELGAPPPPVEAPEPPADLKAEAPELDLHPVTEAPTPVQAPLTTAAPEERRRYVEPTLPLTPPDAAALADAAPDPADELEPLPAIGRAPGGPDVADSAELATLAATPAPEPAVTIDLDDSAAPSPPALDEADFAGDLEEVPLDASGETAFAVFVPPVADVDLDLDSPGEQAAQEADVSARAVEEAVPPLTEPPAAPAAAPNVAHDLGPAPLPASDAPPAIAMAAPPAAIEPVEEAISLPPPLPPNAPTVTAAAADDTPNIAITPTPRRPTVIRDGFNRRGTRPPPKEIMTDAAPPPFAGSRGRSAVSPVGDAVDPFASPSPDAPLEAPAGGGSEAPAGPVSSAAARGGARPIRSGRPAIQPRPTFGPSLIPSVDAAPPTAADLAPAAASAPFAPHSPPPGAAATSEDAEDFGPDLHALRAQRLRRIPTFFLASVLLSLIAAAAIWYSLPVYSNFETTLKFDNFTALSIVEQKNLQDEQRRLLRTASFRVDAARLLRAQHPELSAGFLDHPVSFDRTIQHAYWRDARPGEFVLRHVGRDDADRFRLHAVAAAVFAANQSKADNARRVRGAVKDLSDKVEANSRKLADLRQQIERERLLGEARPTPAQLAQLQSEVGQLEANWNDALARLKDAEAELQRLERALADARDNPTTAPDADETLKKLEAELTDLKARYDTLVSSQSPQAASAREELDAAMDSFSRRIEDARGQGVDSPELANYIAAAENLQKSTRELLDDLIARQQKQQQRLGELKARLDEQARKRIQELRAGDPQLRELIDRREILRRQVNAGAGSDGGVPAEELATARENLRLVENLVQSREEVLASDPLYAEALSSLQSIIDQTEADIAADRKRADEKLEELQKSLAASSPAVAGLPEEQRRLTQEIQAQLSAIADARRRYADVVDLDRASADDQVKQLQGRIAVVQAEVDARRKQLGEDYATRSAAALASAIENHGKLLADAREVESGARTAFEEKSRALRTAREALAASDASDDRLNRLINDRQETERLLGTFNDQLQFKQQELKTVVDVIAPAEQDVQVVRGEDLRPRYMMIAVGAILACFAGATWWTIHSANRLEYAGGAPVEPESLPATPPASAGGKPGAGGSPTGAASAADDPPEHATAV